MIIKPDELQLRHALYPVVDRWSISHMLREADRVPVGDVVEYLLENQSQVFLGDEILRSWIKYGERDYENVYLLAVFNKEKNRSHVVLNLNRAKIGYIDRKGEKYPVFDFKRSSHLVKFSYRDNWFMFPELDQFFRLTPLTSEELFGYYRTGSDIDLGLISRQRFESTYDQ